jgi:hypothetical protein
MKRDIIPRALTALALAILAVALVSCGGLYRGTEGNIYEKMTIFSIILISVVALVLVPFLSGGNGKDLSRFREVVRNAPLRRLTDKELTSYPVYFWDARRSFRKLLFSADHYFSESSIITANGQDPEVHNSGEWALTPEGILQITPAVTGRIKSYCRISPESCGVPTLMRLSSCYAEAWFMGRDSLTRTQIACFGYSASLPARPRFTVSLVSGLTVYWATYPCVIPVASDLVSINPELAFGVIKFNEDGTLSRSTSNTMDSPPDYNLAFSGTWDVDEDLGVVNISVGLYTTEVTLLLHCREDHTMLVGSTAGNGQWFTNPDHAREDLARYLAVGVYLDPEKKEVFL